jgi:putative FmdB family regulatory protein
MAEPYRAAIIRHPVPIYEYKCTNGHVFDVIQRMSDEALTECQECGAPAERVLHPVAIHFKGSGFHNTDYGKKKTGANGSSSEGSKDSSDSKTSESKSSDSKSSDSKSSDSKTAAKAE